MNGQHSSFYVAEQFDQGASTVEIHYFPRWPIKSTSDPRPSHGSHETDSIMIS